MQDCAKVIGWFHWNLVSWLGLPIGRTSELLVVILDHFSTSLAVVVQGILGDLLEFLMQSPADFHLLYEMWLTVHEMTDADNAMNPQHFGSDKAGIRIGIPGFESRPITFGRG